MRSLAVFVLLSAALTLAACSQPAGTGSKVDAGTTVGADAGGCGASCDQGKVCVKDQCVPRTCSTVPCSVDEVCIDGACAAPSCVGVSCPADQLCAAGNCYPKTCATPICDADSVCIDNACRDRRCYQVTCATGAICLRGLCYPTSCGATACSSNQVCENGACVDKDCAGITCATGYLCTGGQCATCAPGYYEDSRSFKCVPKKQQGAACDMPFTCLSGFCVDGVCCDTACDAACHACNGATPGTCAPAAADDADPLCAAYRCKADGACKTTCAQGGDCQAGFSCSAPTCVSKKAKGEGCAAGTECASGFCVDSVCCDSACDKGCDTCNQTGKLGTCSAAPVGSTGVPACGLYLCSGTSADCPATCAASAGCVATHYCHTGACVPKLDDGEVCTLAEQCKNSHCVDGYCCATACTDACHSCAVDGHLGACWIGGGDACDDNDPCTFSDLCQSDGSCAGTQNTCLNDECVGRSCNGTATCTETPLTGGACGGTGSCTAGMCVGDGICGNGETSATSPMECCDEMTPCDQSKMNQGNLFCWSVNGIRMWRLISDTWGDCGSGTNICNSLVDCGGRHGSCVGYQHWDFDHRGDGTACADMASVAGHCQSGVCTPP